MSVRRPIQIHHIEKITSKFQFLFSNSMKFSSKGESSSYSDLWPDLFNNREITRQFQLANNKVDWCVRINSITRRGCSSALWLETFHSWLQQLFEVRIGNIINYIYRMMEFLLLLRYTITRNFCFMMWLEISQLLLRLYL